jgi:hypothetical protein
MLRAGNRDRSGQAGMQQLLIDPWARSNGWGTCGVAETRGMESIYGNVAGIAFVNKLEFGFSRTQYLSGSGADIGINAAAVAVKLSRKNKETGTAKDYGVLGISFFGMTFGDILVTTVDNPEGNMGTFSPSLIHIGVHYAKSFNRYIHGGISGKIVNESIRDMSATGFAIDAGIQYLSGTYENFKIGVTLKNIGIPARYRGDGLSVRGVVSGSSYDITMEQRSADMEMPSFLVLGLSYDFLFWGGIYKEMSKEDRIGEGVTRDDAEHRLTLAGSFTANAYSRDVFSLGVEYGFRRHFMVRAGYTLEAGMWDIVNATTFYAGPSMGVTALIPLVKKGKAPVRNIYLDYGYRFTNRWRGNHYIGIKVAL